MDFDLDAYIIFNTHKEEASEAVSIAQQYIFTQRYADSHSVTINPKTPGSSEHFTEYHVRMITQS
jgi:hypothetical protein